MWICSLQVEFYTRGRIGLTTPPPYQYPTPGAFPMGASLLLVKFLVTGRS